MHFFDFIFNTIQTRANNPKNSKYWLPDMLRNMDGSNPDGRFLPLKGENWDLGPLTGDAADLVQQNMVNQWQLVLNATGKGNLLEDYEAIPDPDKFSPMLSFPDATIEGIFNLFVRPDPVTHSTAKGYDTTITLQFGYYDGTNGRANLTPLSLNGVYKLTQSLCLADVEAPTTNAGILTTEIEGIGKFSASFEEAYIDAELHIDVAGQGKSRVVNVNITRLTLRGAKPGTRPVLDLNNLTINTDIKSLEGFWIEAATQAITSPEGQAGMFANMEATLNAPGQRASLSATITERLRRTLDSMAGSVTPGALPVTPSPGVDNPADAYLFDRIKYALNSPASNWFLPATILALNNPVAEPLAIDRISLPDQNISGIALKNVNITNLKFKGFSNIQVPEEQMTFKTSTEMQCTANLGAMTTPPAVGAGVIPAPPIIGTANFSMQPPQSPALTGSFTVTILKGQLKFSNTYDGEGADQLTVTLKQAQLLIQTSDMIIEIKVQSAFKDMINQILNKDNIKRDILAKLNEQLAGNLGTISSEITQGVRRGIASRLS